MRTELVVLDMAGTTIRDDDAVNRCLREALLSGGVAVSAAEVNVVMGIPKPTAIRRLLEAKGQKDAPPEQVAGLHDRFLRRMISFYRGEGQVEPTEGAVDALAQLRRAGVKVGLDTGFSRDIVNVILERLGWTGNRVVDFTVASDEVAHGRPEPDLIWESMRLAGVATGQQVAKVGDTPSDLVEGNKAGCGLVIGVTNGTHTRQELSRHPHTHLIGSLRELPALILE